LATFLHKLNFRRPQREKDWENSQRQLPKKASAGRVLTPIEIHDKIWGKSRANGGPAWQRSLYGKLCGELQNPGLARRGTCGVGEKGKSGN